MKIEDLYTEEGLRNAKARINNLSSGTKPEWGSMNAPQVLAHLNVAYDMTFTDKYPKVGAIQKFMIKLFAKNQVVGDKPYPKNGRTAPEFIIEGAPDFDAEKQRLFDYMDKMYNIGRNEMDGRASRAFGKLTSNEWNMMFSKHLDHHMTQFGV